MISLAVKYRPKSFSDVVEQDNIKIILQQQISSGEIKNAYLFCGPAGDGKTTCARIFAKEINKGCGNPIEMDAASNSGVDDVKAICKQAQTKSLDSEYKVFIIDECFAANTPIMTPSGQKPISSIRVGDIVESMSGNQVVTHIFKNKVLTDRLCCVTIDNKKIITTVEHLFFTNNGWIEASQLMKGDVVYGSKDLQELRKGVCKTAGQRREVLLQQLCDEVSVHQHDTRAEKSSSERTTNMSYMSTDICSEKDLFSKNLFLRVQNSAYYEVEYTLGEYRIWDGVTETVIRKNEEIEPYETSREHTKNVEHEETEWNSPSMEWCAGWKRKIYDSTDRLVEGIRRWLGVGIPNKHEKSELARTSTSLVLQSRPWLFKEKAGDRGRWSQPQTEKFIIKGCEKNRSLGNARVESVEVYKPGYNDRLFESSFTNSELSSGYVTMYDLEVDNGHSYFVEDILVHNCHAISNTGWQAFLKLIEEPPAKSIFIFCTTDPQKIPKTILSRVQRYDFKMISQVAICRRLEFIYQTEAVQNDWECNYNYKDGMEYIAKLADGHMRDALTMLDKCIAYSHDITLENVIKCLGALNYEEMFAFTDHILKLNLKKALDTVENIYNSGRDIKLFLKQYIQFLLDICKLQIGCDWSYTSIPAIEEYNIMVGELDDCRDILSAMINVNSNIKYSDSPKYDIEAALFEFMRD